MNIEHLTRILSAGVSAVCAQVVVQPLETIKVRIQNDQHNKYTSIIKTVRSIYYHENIVNLWNGMIPSIIRELIYSSLRFGLYVPIKTNIKNLFKVDNEVFIVKLTSGGISGGISSFVSNPFDLLKCRSQATIGNTNLVRLAKNIHKHGIRHFWKGSLATFNRAVILNSVKLSSYDEIKYSIAKLSNLNPSDKKCIIASSFITGFIVTCIIAPIDFARTRYMCSNMNNNKHHIIYKSTLDVLINEPVYRWFKGFYPQWGRYGPYAVIHFYVWELICKWLGIIAI